MFIENIDIEMRLSIISFLGIGIFLCPFFFHDVTSLHPPSFQRNDFSTCSTLSTHYFDLGQSPNKNGM